MVLYDKWRQQQEQQREQTLQQQNEYWDTKCYWQIAAADEEANRTYDESHWDSNSHTHQTIPPTSDWNDDKGQEYNNEYDDDDAEYDFEDDNEGDEYDSDHQMYTKMTPLTVSLTHHIVETPPYTPPTLSIWIQSIWIQPPKYPLWHNLPTQLSNHPSTVK